MPRVETPMAKEMLPAMIGPRRFVSETPSTYGPAVVASEKDAPKYVRE
jgi:hypothetical protein